MENLVGNSRSSHIQLSVIGYRRRALYTYFGGWESGGHFCGNYGRTDGRTDRRTDRQKRGWESDGKKKNPYYYK